MSDSWQCEAVCETGREGKSRRMVAGERCRNEGDYERDLGRFVCWPHKTKAQEGRVVFFDETEPKEPL